LQLLNRKQKKNMILSQKTKVVCMYAIAELFFFRPRSLFVAIIDIMAS